MKGAFLTTAVEFMVLDQVRDGIKAVSFRDVALVVLVPDAIVLQLAPITKTRRRDECQSIVRRYLFKQASNQSSISVQDG